MDEQLGLTKIAGEYLEDKRHGKNIQHEMEGLLRQSVYSRLGGYEDTNDAEGLRKDPGMRAVIGNRALAKAGAGETTVGRFEKEILLGGDNLGNLDEILKQWTEKVDSVRGMKEIIMDIDSSESPVYGEQEGSSYNGHFLSRCYHPLLVFNQYGDCLKVKLRPGNVHSADGWQEFLEPTLRSYAEKGINIKVRGDAAFAIPGLYELCEELGIDYAVRIKEGKYALNWTRLSCRGFKENEVRLKLFIMAYNLGNIFRTLALPEKIRSWSLRTIQLKLIKMGGRLIKHARYYYLLLAEATINERIWKSIMQKISGLCPAPG